MADIGGYLNLIRTATSGEAVRNAIVECMREINADSVVKATNLVVTSSANRTYKPGKGKAFKSVTINIDGSGESDPSKTLTYDTFNVTNETENGTYNAPDGTVYGSVNVELDFSGEGDIADEATMTFTRTDPTSKMKYWEPEWEDFKPAKRIWIKTKIDVDDDGEGGGSSSTGPFRVTCKALGSTVRTIEGIELGSSVSNQLPTKEELEAIGKGTNSKGQQFSYWSELNGGNFSSVQKNFSAEAVYADNVTAGSISDSWTQIIEKGGASYGCGSTKQYVLETPVTLGKFSVVSGATKNLSGDHAITTYIGRQYTYRTAITFMKVAEGELGTTSSWLSLQPVELNDDIWGLVEDSSSPDSGIDAIGNDYGADDAVSYRGYKLLDAFFVEMFKTDGLGAAIAKVPKLSWRLPSNAISRVQYMREGAEMVNKTSGMSRLWLPSFGELASFVNSAKSRDAIDTYYRGSQNYDPTYLDIESGQPDYGLYWRPTQATSNTDCVVTTRSTTFYTGWHSTPWQHTRAIYWDDFATAAAGGDLVNTCSINGGYFSIGDSNKFYIGFCLKPAKSS